MPDTPNRPRVLVVDDEVLIREFVAVALERCGYAVSIAPDGATAEQLIEAHPDCEIALIDLSMPGMDGAETLAALRKRAPSIRAILMSGGNEHQVDGELLRTPAVQYLQKPFTHRELLNRIRSHPAG